MNIWRYFFLILFDDYYYTWYDMGLRNQNAFDRSNCLEIMKRNIELGNTKPNLDELQNFWDKHNKQAHPRIINTCLESTDFYEEILKELAEKHGMRYDSTERPERRIDLNFIEKIWEESE